MAWRIEALSRRKRLPRLESLLMRRAQRGQTVTQQRSMLQILSAQYGIALRTAGAPATKKGQE